MIPLRIILEGDGAFPDCHELGNVSAMSFLSNGTQQGNPTITVEITLANGQKIYGQTTQKLFDMAAGAFRARMEFEAEQLRGKKPS